MEQITALLGSSWLPWAGGGLVILVACILLRRMLGRIFRLLLRTGAGLAGLFLFSQVGSLIGVTLGVNLINALVLALLGLPGFGLLLLLQWTSGGAL